jgi:ribosomal protein S18 acetylase RimI-like enzyme
VTVRLHRLRAGEGEPLRELRLRALADAPSAFADTFDAQRRLPLEIWTGWARAAEDAGNVTIVAVDDDRWVGMIVGRLLAADTAWLEALWVDPQARRRRLGERLIEAVADWARERGAVRLDLSVTEGNAAARALYAHAGFAPTGRRRPLPSDPGRIEIFLTRAL